MPSTAASQTAEHGLFMNAALAKKSAGGAAVMPMPAARMPARQPALPPLARPPVTSATWPR